MSDIAAHGRIVFRDGSEQFLADQMIARVVYAMTTLALTQARDHVHVAEIYNSKGALLWPPNADLA